MTERDRVGFIGLGAMGGRMASTLLDRGHDLAIFDIDPGTMAPLADRGATAYDSPLAVADAAARILVSLPTPDVVRTVVTGKGGVLHGRSVTTVVDLSTTGAETAVEMAAILRAASVDYVDAPVTGGVAGLEAGELAVIVAGADEPVERVRPLLEPFGHIYRAGSEPGQGQTAKLLNNLLSATALAVTCEAVLLGARAGLDPTGLLDIFNAGSGRNTATASKFPTHVLTRSFASGFRLKLMAKDVELCLAEARAHHVSMPVGGAVQQLWTMAAACAEDGDDHTEIARLYEKWSGTSLIRSEGVAHDGSD